MAEADPNPKPAVVMDDISNRQILIDTLVSACVYGATIIVTVVLCWWVGTLLPDKFRPFMSAPAVIPVMVVRQIRRSLNAKRATR